MLRLPNPLKTLRLFAVLVIGLIILAPALFV